jgi:adenylate cyclase
VDAHNVERRMAAILAADAVGYSRLMSADEEATLRTLRSHRELFDAAIARHGGRIFSTAGDSVVAEFASPVQAVRCAVEAQRALAERNAALPEARRMHFRIGLHLGDVMVNGADLLGDGVNVAARLEALAPPGGVILSRAMVEQVRAALPLDYRYLGDKTLKNIGQKVAVYGIGNSSAPTERRWLIAAVACVVLALAAGGVVWRYSSGEGPSSALPAPVSAPVAAGLPALPADRPSIAVLPFENLSGNAEETYFSDGMTQDLITDLSNLSGLLVIARGSSFAYRGKDVSVVQVGRELNARYLVEGSIRRAGQRVRITAQLLDTASNSHIWAERYDRELKDMFDLQDDVRQKIVAALAIKLAPGERERLMRKPTNNVAAYDAWARGLALEARFAAADIQEARRMFLRAIELDPNFARAYGKVANTYAVEVNSGWVDAADAVPNSVRYAEQAVALDDGLPEAHWALAYAYAWDGQLPRALAHIEKAITLNPNYADAMAYYGLLLSYDGRPGEGQASVARAMRVNPQYPHWYDAAMGNNLYMLGRYEDAAAQLKRGLERNPSWAGARRILVATYGQLGRIDDAQWEIAELETAGSALTVSRTRTSSPYRDPASLDHLLDGLRKAGVKE